MTVINGGIPDRVPISLHNFQMAVERSGRPYDEVLKSGELLAQVMIDEWQEFRHDIILLEIGTACSAEAMGAKVEYDVDRSAVSHGPAIASLDEVGTLVIPDNFEDKPSWKVTLDAVRDLTKLVLTDAMDGGGLICGPGCALGGPTPPENIHALCETVREFGVYH
jgi:uroporphyrinogen-III decarboxylase